MASKPSVFIASRGSPLALAQANFILSQCKKEFPEIPFELKIIKTTGDKLQSVSISGIDSTLPRGLFTKEIEEALLNNEADLAVHSLKDLPTILPPGLKLAATPKRADARDVLIYRKSKLKIQNSKLQIKDLPNGATIATSSPRRRAQLLEHRADLKIVPIRGNVGTRLQKLSEQAELDGIILAAAGLERLNFRINSEEEMENHQPQIVNPQLPLPVGLQISFLNLDEMLPCVGQAALGIEIRRDDDRLETICEKLNHSETWACVTAERAFLSAMGGGCQSAVAAYAEISGKEIRLRAVSYLGEKVQRGEKKSVMEKAIELGQQLAAEIKSQSD
ncbi:MAG: hydroxymethylbilane synthase [Verrucomicrobiota bacterium]|nr:hydroxymethylbilane synthase [Verrucomicrobiota bacterium]